MRNRTLSYHMPKTTQTDNHSILPQVIATINHSLLVIAALLLACASVSAAQLTLAWDANDPTPDGYNVYWRTKDTRFNYSEPIWSGKNNRCTVNLPNVPENIQCYFVVRAFVDDDESGDSNEVGYLLEAASDDTQETKGSTTLQSYIITATAGDYGTITPSGRTTVAGGGDKTFTIVPDTGYTITDVKVDGLSMGAVSKYTFNRVTADHNIAVTFRYANQRPVANAGADQTARPSAKVTLSGSASSDPEGFQLNYKWIQTSGPAVTIVDAGTARPTFTAPDGTNSEQALSFQLTVTDQEGASSNDYCIVRISALEASKQQPQADAGTNLMVPAGATVTLNGSNSIAPDGILTSYSWVQTAGPTVKLAIKSPAVATFTAPAPSNGHGLVLVFELTVTDDTNRTCTDTCLVLVTCRQPENGEGGDTSTNQGGNSTSDHDDLANTQKDSVDNIDDTGNDWNDADSTSTGQNQPPLQPSILYPQTGESSVSLRPKIVASAFRDSDAQDYHIATEWRIIDTESQNMVLNVKRSYYLTYLRVPMFILDYGTTYSCQVRYFDQYGNSSDWSPETTFTTYNKILWWREAETSDDEFALDTNDLSSLDTPDTLAIFRTLDERHVISVSSHDIENFIALESSGPVSTGDEASTPPDFDKGLYRYGLIGNRIEVAIPGAETTFRLNIDDDLSGKTNWITFTADGQWIDDQLSVEPLSDGRSVIRTVTDGGKGDADGVANGVIVDLVAPMEEPMAGDYLPASQEKPMTSSEDSGQMGCFIGSLMR